MPPEAAAAALRSRRKIFKGTRVARLSRVTRPDTWCQAELAFWSARLLSGRLSTPSPRGRGNRPTMVNFVSVFTVIEITHADTNQIEHARQLFKEYAAWLE